MITIDELDAMEEHNNEWGEIPCEDIARLIDEVRRLQTEVEQLQKESPASSAAGHSAT